MIARMVLDAISERRYGRNVKKMAESLAAMCEPNPTRLPLPYTKLGQFGRSTLGKATRDGKSYERSRI